MGRVGRLEGRSRRETKDVALPPNQNPVEALVEHV
jgi:hypothetical protein